MPTEKEIKNTAQVDEKEDIIQSTERREAMQKLGKFSIYMPPAVLTLLASKRAFAQSLGGPPDPPP